MQLAHNWWIWGYDSQLGEDIDKPQADFFAAVARKMSDDAKVIPCAGVPSWLEADLKAPDPTKREAFYRALDYTAGILKDVTSNIGGPAERVHDHFQVSLPVDLFFHSVAIRTSPAITSSCVPLVPRSR